MSSLKEVLHQKVSLENISKAFQIYSSDGIHKNLRMIRSIEDKNGNLIMEYKSNESKKVLSDSLRLAALHLLIKAGKEGTAMRLDWKYKLDNEIMAKTGTTYLHLDAWTVGMTPKLTCGIWVGSGENSKLRFRTIGLGQGANMALPVYARFVQELNGDSMLSSYVQGSFDIPESFHFECK